MKGTDSRGDTGLSAASDGPTQKAAATSRKRPTQRRQVLAVILGAMRKGITFSELEDAMGLSYSSVGPRVRELRADGLVADSGRTRESMNSGRQQVIWVAWPWRPDREGRP